MDQGERAARRILAGLCIEQKLVDRKIAKRWQAAVQSGSFDPDACADEVLADAGDKVNQSAEVLARAGGLERDFLMMSLQTGMRGATRRAKRAGKGFLAYLLANLIAIGAYSLVVGALLILLRDRYGWSYDGAIDRVVDFVRGLF